MKNSTLLHFAARILVAFFVIGWGIAVAEEKNEPTLFQEQQAFSVQIGSKESKDDLALWQKTDKAMLLSPDKGVDLDPASGVDLRLSLDKLQFKSSIQQKKSAEDLLLASPHMNTASSPDMSAISTDIAASVGYQLDLLNKKLSVVPMMGLSYHGQDDNRILGNDSSSEWNSWWVGLDLRANPRPDLSIETSFLLHNAKFSEKGADLGLGTESYKSEGEGKVFKLGLRQRFGNSWSAGILYSWQQWMAEKGELPSALTSDKGNNVPFGGDIQEVNISLSYDF
ncbi:hypothetical protein LJC24_05190 [Desulfococcaceae bacterium OttesenSCG-928-F15]|nr:hypothetical protein [Desulfococcaceae bacterium OttesenSCG-928-F15]